jgi:hypothetical protein
MEPTTTAHPPSNNDNGKRVAKEHDVLMNVICMEEEGNKHIFTDQTGRLPKKSSHVNQYIMVLSHPDSNATLQEPLKNHIFGKMNRAYQVLIDRLASAGVKHKQHILNNKCSKEFKQAIASNRMSYQLAPTPTTTDAT